MATPHFAVHPVLAHGHAPPFEVVRRYPAYVLQGQQRPNSTFITVKRLDETFGWEHRHAMH